MNEEPLDLRRFGRALLRAKWVLVAFAAVGMVAAGLFTLVHPPQYSATTLVLLPPSSLDTTGKPVRNIDTQVAVASSEDVLGLMKPLRPPLSVQDLQKRVRVSAPTPDLLKFQGTAGSSGGALAIANGSAEAYARYAQQTAADQVKAAVSQLQTRVNELKNEIADLQTKINNASAKLQTLPTNSPEASAQSSLIASLHAQQTDLSQEQTANKTQISAAQVNANEANSGVKIISRATTASNGALAKIATTEIIGLLLGLFAGVAFVLARDSRDRRLRRGIDIATAVGAPAVASLQTQPPQNLPQWQHLFEQYEPTADESWGVRRVVRAVLAAQQSRPATITVLSLPGDERAATVGPQLACFAASAGVRTTLVAGRDSVFAPLADPSRQLLEGVRANLNLVEALPESSGSADDDPQLVVIMAITEQPALDLDPNNVTTTLLAVAPGVATPERLRAVAGSAADAKHGVAGVIVANPEAGDGPAGDMGQPAKTRTRRAARAQKHAGGSAS
jgi:capsular polysaccharide biosynthesis protein